MSATASRGGSKGQFSSFVSIGKRRPATEHDEVPPLGGPASPSVPLPKDLLVVLTDAHGTHVHVMYTKRSKGPARAKAAMLSQVSMPAARAPSVISAASPDLAVAGPAAQLQTMVDQASIKRADPLLLKLQQKAVHDVLNGTAWLTSKDVGERADPLAKNKHSLASRWLKENRIFAIYRRGQNEFPEYQFDPLGQPIDAVSKVLEIFGGYSPFRIAAWFESASSELGTRRPREVISEDPSTVIDAAAAHVRGALHG